MSVYHIRWPADFQLINNFIPPTATVVCDENAQFECNGNRFTENSKICIPVSYVCDHDDDCGDNSDEDPANCPSTTTFRPMTTTTPCASSEFFCPASRDRYEPTLSCYMSSLLLWAELTELTMFLFILRHIAFV